MLHDIDAIAGSPTGLREEYINRIFLEAAESLDLSPTQHKEAQESYLAVGSWLDAPDSPLRRFRPNVYAQGSFALGTCVKPLGRDDFDLDAVCELLVSAAVTPGELKKLIGDCLRAHCQYRTMLEEKARCWRLNYARDFHLDIIPAKPKWPGTENMSI